MTGWMDNYIRRGAENSEGFSHVYEYTEAEKRRMHKVHQTHDNELMLSGFATMFRDYRLIGNCCKCLSVELSNATQETALDNLAYSSLDVILDGLEN